MEKLVAADESNQQEEEYAKPDPKLHPRNIALAEIANQVAKDHKVEFSETAQVVDDDGRPVEAPPAVEDAPEVVEEEAPAEAVEEPSSPAEPVAAATPSQEAIEPSKEYEVTIDGQKMKVPGQKIIDAGFRTFQKETAADYRLKLATDLMQKATEQYSQATPQGAAAVPVAQPASTEETAAELAQAIQYGTPEQATAAMNKLLSRNAVDPMQIRNVAVQEARNEVRFEEGLKFVQSEYPDLLANDHVKRLFFAEENRYRTPKERGGMGDTRPHKDVYQEIGDSIRKSLNMPKPATGTTQGKPTVVATAASRQERKAAVAPVPRTAAGRIGGGQDAPKVKTTSEIIAAMAARRGQGSLTNQQRKE